MALFLILPLSLSAEERFTEILKLYEGRWVGHFTIHSPETNFTQSFPVEQHFWIDNGELHGISVTDRDEGMESAQSITRSRGGQLYSELKNSSGQVENFVGTIHDNGIVWLPIDLKRVTDYQIKESFIRKDGDQFLLTEGFDTYNYKGEKAHLVIKGELRFEEE